MSKILNYFFPKKQQEFENVKFLNRDFITLSLCCFIFVVSFMLIYTFTLQVPESPDRTVVDEFNGKLQTIMGLLIIVDLILCFLLYLWRKSKSTRETVFKFYKYLVVMTIIVVVFLSIVINMSFDLANKDQTFIYLKYISIFILSFTLITIPFSIYKILNFDKELFVKLQKEYLGGEVDLGRIFKKKQDAWYKRYYKTVFGIKN